MLESLIRINLEDRNSGNQVNNWARTVFAATEHEMENLRYAIVPAIDGGCINRKVLLR